MSIQGLDRNEAMLTNAVRVKNLIDTGTKAHQKGGVCYEATKSLLYTYRKIKYDKLAVKMRETEAAFKEYEYVCGDQRKGDYTLEDLVTISDQRLLCWNTLQGFIDSGDSAAANTLVLLVDLSLQLLKKETPAYTELLNAAFITGERRGMASDTIAGELGLARTTYYRERDKSITALSEIIFGYLAERHPDCLLTF